MAPIFRDQPPHTHFNKSFEDDSADSLFLCLNEIDPLYTRREQRLDNSAFECVAALIDPRTGKAVQQVLYDHKTACAAPPKLFYGGAGRSSSLTKGQHVACLRVQRAQQEQGEVQEQDLLLWRRLMPQRQREKQEMQKFVYDYAQTHKEQMYAPAKRLVELYKTWYARQTEMLLQREPETTFNTHLGLPHVRVCAGNDSVAEIMDVQLLRRSGWMPVRQPDADYRKLHIKLEAFATLSQNAPQKENVLFSDEINTHMAQLNLQQPHESNTIFFIPLKSLLLILTAGEYCDLPSEVLLDIEHDLENDSKLIAFQNPLPARHCGFHTHKEMLQQAMAGQRSISGATKWLQMEKDQISCVTEAEAPEMLTSQKQESYAAPLKFEEYLQKYQSNTPRTTLVENTEKIHTAALVKWSLKDALKSDATLTLFSTLPLPLATENSCETGFIASHTLKLEFKPQFGCEVMTKYDLLEIWLQMRLLNTPQAHCTRISAGDFETQSEQPLTLAKVEQELLEIYQVKTPQLLAKLGEFLRLLLNIGAGRYMLRFNPKFRDKLMLCAPSREITQNTVSLHGLLRSEPSDLLFMTQLQFLPIADDLCSVVHLHHQVLPCAFRPNSKNKPRNFDAATVPPTMRMTNGHTRTLLHDRTHIKMALVTERSRLNKNSRSAAAKARKRKRAAQKRAVEQEKCDDETELQKDIKADKLLYG